MTAVSEMRQAIAALEQRLRSAGTAARAAGSKAYLKSALEFTGNDVASLRREVRAWRAAFPNLQGAALWSVVEALWRRGIFELRLFALELLVARSSELSARDLPRLEALLRDAQTWALVDVIAPRLVGPVLEREPRAVGRALDRWSRDEDFWVRRGAILALLLPMRRGEGDWVRFERYADALIGDREFFIRKAIGWVLREAATRTPGRVIAFVEPRASCLAGVTWREAVRKLPANDRSRLERMRTAASPARSAPAATAARTAARAATRR